eukprot:15358932-Ditylum_brightwellii.AAC.1
MFIITPFKAFAYDAVDVKHPWAFLGTFNGLNDIMIKDIISKGGKSSFDTYILLFLGQAKTKSSTFYRSVYNKQTVYSLKMATNNANESVPPAEDAVPYLMAKSYNRVPVTPTMDNGVQEKNMS